MALLVAGCGCEGEEVHSEGSAPSCVDLAATCGATSESCCTSLLVPGGTFSRSYDAVDYRDDQYEATVSPFYLDKFEVTVGRFRKFLEAGFGTQEHPPNEGTGAHPKVAGSGWKTQWNKLLPVDTQAARTALDCYLHKTFTQRPQANENKPVTCLDWYAAAAFCAWDGGRLPTEAEWNYAASGGSEHRYFPWSSPPTSAVIDESYAVYSGKTFSFRDVGSKPRGDGKWGHSDLGGNAWEWMLDVDPVVYPMPCNDCAFVGEGPNRAFRSGSSDELAPTLRSATRHVIYPYFRGNISARCARDAE